MNVLKHITFHLCDLNENLIVDWKFYFEDLPKFKFYNCDIWSVSLPCNSKNAIISSANSFGDLQGGIDLIYYSKFGYKLEEDLQRKICKNKFGELTVGDALIIPIEKNDTYNYFISAPTMRVPMNIQNTANVYLAFRAALIELIKFNSKNEIQIDHVVCPGLGTGIGKIEPEICAKQMWYAYNSIINPIYYLDLVSLSLEHCFMTKKDQNILD